MKIILFSILALISQSLVGETLTISQLLENSEYFDGKNVIVKGVLHIEFESNSLNDGNRKLALDFFSKPYTAESISLAEAKIEEYKAKFQGETVLVEGIFNRTRTGHFGMFDATIENISSVTEQQKPHNNARQ